MIPPSRTPLPHQTRRSFPCRNSHCATCHCSSRGIWNICARGVTCHWRDNETFRDKTSATFRAHITRPNLRVRGWR
jgi:hypothetical protein